MSDTAPPPRFSLVIPAYNEEELLPRLLDSVDEARRRYQGGRDAIEVIVADNASTDRTAEVARARGCVVVPVEKRAIAAARNGGARAARGEILTFIDADSSIDPSTFDEIDRILTDRIVGGATGLRLEKQSPGTALTFAMLVAVGSLLRVALGEPPILNIDAGVVFCRRRDFDEIGGYNERRLYAEDAQLLFDLKRLARKRGQRLARGSRAPAMFSTRKFDQHGQWHYFILPLRMLLSVFGPRSDDWARRYWYER